MSRTICSRSGALENCEFDWSVRALPHRRITVKRQVKINFAGSGISDEMQSSVGVRQRQVADLPQACERTEMTLH